MLLLNEVIELQLYLLSLVRLSEFDGRQLDTDLSQVDGDSVLLLVRLEIDVRGHWLYSGEVLTQGLGVGDVQV